LIFNTLNIPAQSRSIISVPIQFFSVIIFVFEMLQKIFNSLGFKKLSLRFEDGAEIANIVRYYATEVIAIIVRLR